ncbi:MAG: N-formylglutamate amidohydrolase [Candidatus Cloacimonadota bacterium]|nr:N-formylglutamate amidohydrolase [Candidatus Cloacimonadota bacterium]
MNHLAEFNFKYESPIVCTAIHNGHNVSKEVQENLAISEDIRLMEEDPFTERFTQFSSNTIIGRTSRFEVDLNRPAEKCIYKNPEDAWDIQTRKETPSDLVISQSLAKYDEFYTSAKNHFVQLEKKFGRFFVYDIHSYNHHRKGLKTGFDDPKLNPEIIIGTNNMPEKWFPLVDTIQNKITSFDYFGRSLDARINVKFPGGHFSRWIHNNFPDSACCIAIEFKKIWMDEWTGDIYEDKLNKLIESLNSTHDLIESELKKY